MRMSPNHKKVLRAIYQEGRAYNKQIAELTGISSKNISYYTSGLASEFYITPAAIPKEYKKAYPRQVGIVKWWMLTLRGKRAIGVIPK